MPMRSASRGQALGGGDGGHRGVVRRVAAGRLRDRDRAEHRQQQRDAVALRPFHAAQHVRLGDVGDLVAEHGGHLVLGLGRQHQARVHADVAAQRGEGVDAAVLHHEEGEGLLGVVAGRGQAVAGGLQPALDQRVLQHVAVVAQLGQEHASVLRLLRRTQHGAGRGPDVGQPAFLGAGAGATRQHQQGGGKQGAESGEAGGHGGPVAWKWRDRPGQACRGVPRGE
jgi:hypothetical protein